MAARKSDSMAWVKGQERLLESALAAIDAVSLETRFWSQWRSARSAVWSALKGSRDLRRLAETIARHEKLNEVKDCHARIVKQQRRSGPSPKARQAESRKTARLRSNWSESRTPANLWKRAA